MQCHCPSSPRPLPHTAHPCLLSACVGWWWVEGRGAAEGMAGPLERRVPPSPSLWRPVAGLWRGAEQAE